MNNANTTVNHGRYVINQVSADWYNAAYFETPYHRGVSCDSQHRSLESILKAILWRCDYNGVQPEVIRLRDRDGNWSILMDNRDADEIAEERARIEAMESQDVAK
jgi:hypothetical protein